jgi:hypothetical protein
MRAAIQQEHCFDILVRIEIKPGRGLIVEMINVGWGDPSLRLVQHVQGLSERLLHFRARVADLEAVDCPTNRIV